MQIADTSLSVPAMKTADTSFSVIVTSHAEGEHFFQCNCNHTSFSVIVTSHAESEHFF